MLINLMLFSPMTARGNAWTHRGPSQWLTRYWTGDKAERLSAFRFAWSVSTSKVGRWMRRVSQKKGNGSSGGGCPLDMWVIWRPIPL
jgi:hypothetical protein